MRLKTIRDNLYIIVGIALIVILLGGYAWLFYEENHDSIKGYWVPLNTDVAGAFPKEYMQIDRDKTGMVDGTAYIQKVTEQYIVTNNNGRSKVLKYWFKDKRLYLQNDDDIYIYINLDRASEDDKEVYYTAKDYDWSGYGKWSISDGANFYTFELKKDEDGNDHLISNLPKPGAVKKGSGYELVLKTISIDNIHTYTLYPIDEQNLWVYCYADDNLYQMIRNYS